MQYHIEDKYLYIDCNSLTTESLEAFCDLYLPSARLRYQLINEKKILLDGKAIDLKTSLKGEELALPLYLKGFKEGNAQSKGKINIVYEDPFLLAVNKPSGIIVHSDGNPTDNLTDRIKNHYLKKGEDLYDLQPLHRLDKETSGLVLFSKSALLQPLFDRMIEEKAIRRYYRAFVKGKLPSGQKFTIDDPIGRDRHDAKRMIIHPKGQKAITKVTSLGYSIKGYSLLSCQILSGKTHQIRLHLAHAGYPILNDPLYGIPSSLCRHMALMAERLTFFHPIKEENCDIRIIPDQEWRFLEEDIRE